AIAWPRDIVQPYEFGHDASKATCITFADENGESLMLKLQRDPAKRIAGRMVDRDKAMGKSDRANGNQGPLQLERWANQTDTGQNRISPGDERWKERSRTYPGIADAIVAA